MSFGSGGGGFSFGSNNTNNNQSGSGFGGGFGSNTANNTGKQTPFYPQRTSLIPRCQEASAQTRPTRVALALAPQPRIHSVAVRSVQTRTREEVRESCAGCNGFTA